MLLVNQPDRRWRRAAPTSAEVTCFSTYPRVVAQTRHPHRRHNKLVQAGRPAVALVGRIAPSLTRPAACSCGRLRRAEAPRRCDVSGALRRPPVPGAIDPATPASRQRTTAPPPTAAASHRCRAGPGLMCPSFSLANATSRSCERPAALHADKDQHQHADRMLSPGAQLAVEQDQRLDQAGDKHAEQRAENVARTPVSIVPPITTERSTVTRTLGNTGPCPDST